MGSTSLKVASRVQVHLNIIIVVLSPNLKVYLQVFIIILSKLRYQNNATLQLTSIVTNINQVHICLISMNNLHQSMHMLQN